MHHVLSLCQHNNAYNQIARIYLHHLGKDPFEIKSTELKQTALNRLVIGTMPEEGFDISKNKTINGFDLCLGGEPFKYLIARCSMNMKTKRPTGVGQNKSLPEPLKPHVTDATNGSRRTCGGRI